MDEAHVSSKKVFIISIIAILFSAAFAIFVHAILPASVDVVQFNSILVQWFGFPAVSTFYFILLFTHCAVSVRYIGLRTNASKLQTGIRFGIAYALIYIFGMQEIVLDYSPFSSWGFEFVRYQFLIGIGDGIPALLLCLIISYFTLKNNNQNKTIPTLNLAENIKVIAIIMFTFLLERLFFYQTGLINSECASYLLPCYIWTGMFGVMIGYIFVILYPLLSYGADRALWVLPLRFILTIGLNWTIFNSFMGLIIKGIMPQMLLRSGLDVVGLFLILIVLQKYILNRKVQ